MVRAHPKSLAVRLEEAPHLHEPSVHGEVLPLAHGAQHHVRMSHLRAAEEEGEVGPFQQRLERGVEGLRHDHRDATVEQHLVEPCGDGAEAVRDEAEACPCLLYTSPSPRDA